MNTKQKLKELWLQVETHNKYDAKDMRVEIYTDMNKKELQELIDYTYCWCGKVVKVKSNSKHKQYLFTPSGI